jgi:glycosyltransferase involved in cell wall biosynthesis
MITSGPQPLSALETSPLVSIVLTSYNYAEFIREALDSVLCQSYHNLEVIVADDGSTDETTQIVRQYEKQDSRVRLIAGQNLGQPQNTNRGYASTTGEIICFLDADDRFRPGKVQAVVDAFSARPAHGLFLHHLQRIDGLGRPFGSFYPRHIDAGWLHDYLLDNGGRCSFPATSALSIRREIAQQVFPIRTASRRVGDAYIHFPAAFLTTVRTLPEMLSDYRCHEKSMTRASESTITKLLAFLLEYEEVFSTNRLFVAGQFGEAVASRLTLTDCQDYLENVLKYLTLSGLDTYNGRSTDEFMGSMRARRQKVKWAFLLSLPLSFTRSCLFLRSALLTATRSCRTLEGSWLSRNKSQTRA